MMNINSLSFKLIDSNKDQLKNYKLYMKNYEKSNNNDGMQEKECNNDEGQKDNIIGIISFYENNLYKSKAYFLQAINKNNINAMLNLAYIYDINHDNHGIKYYLLALKNNYKNVFYDIATEYFYQNKYFFAHKYYKYIIESKIYENSLDIVIESYKNIIVIIRTIYYNDEVLISYLIKLNSYEQLSYENAYFVADYYYFNKNFNNAITYFKICKKYYNIALCYKNLIDYDESKYYFLKSISDVDNEDLVCILDDFSKLPNLDKTDMTLLANKYYNIKEYSKAITYYHLVKNNFVNLGWSYIHLSEIDCDYNVRTNLFSKGIYYVMKSKSNIDIGLLYEKYIDPIDFKKAIYYYKKELGMPDSYNKVIALFQLAMHENELKYYLEIVRLYDVNIVCDSIDINIIYVSIARIYINNNNYDYARYYLTKCLINKYVPALLLNAHIYELENNYTMAIIYYSMVKSGLAYNNIGCIYRDNLKVKLKAIEYFELAIQLGSEKAVENLYNIKN